jgi:serine protease AprX
VLDDVVADFTNGGNSTRRPDLVAPGRSIVSLRNPGSSADVDHPEGRVSGDTSARFFRGSGTSQAAAVVSGAAALLLQQRPTLTPDQVKKLLTSTAVKLPADPSPAQGAGRLNVLGALRARIPTTAQTWPNATGLGSLEFSRGSSHVYDTETGDSLTGEKDVLGGTWDGGRWSQTAWNETSWAGGTWNGTRWTGDTWSSDTQSMQRWSGAVWEGERWSGLPWSGLPWSGASWNGLRWSGDDWSGLRWSGLRWSADGWARDGWSGCRWF